MRRPAWRCTCLGVAMVASRHLLAHEVRQEEIIVTGRAVPLIGFSPSASSGQIGAVDLAARPVLRAVYRWQRRVELALDVFNLFDAGDPDISYVFASCLPGDPAALCGAAPRSGVEDRHAHPVEPGGVRATLTLWF